MRALNILLLLTAFTSGLFSQATASEHLIFSKQQLSQFTNIHELSAKLPKDATIMLIELTAMVSGSVIKITDKEEQLSEKAKEIFKKVPTGSKVFIDIKYKPAGAESKKREMLALSILVTN